MPRPMVTELLCESGKEELKNSLSAIRQEQNKPGCELWQIAGLAVGQHCKIMKTYENALQTDLQSTMSMKKLRQSKSVSVHL